MYSTVPPCLQRKALPLVDSVTGVPVRTYSDLLPGGSEGVCKPPHLQNPFQLPGFSLSRALPAMSSSMPFSSLNIACFPLNVKFFPQKVVGKISWRSIVLCQFFQYWRYTQRFLKAKPPPHKIYASSGLWAQHDGDSLAFVTICNLHPYPSASPHRVSLRSGIM